MMTKIVEALFQPIGFLWMLHVLAAIVLLRQKKWRGAAFSGSIAVFMVVIGSTKLPSRLLASLERPYAGQRLADIPECDAVIMLGGTLAPSSNDAFGIDFGEQADRVVKAVELIRQGKARALVLGGGGGEFKAPSHAKWKEADLLQRWLEAWGLAPATVVQLAASLNTREEVAQIGDLAKKHGWKRLILVTSASHLKRSEAIFRKLGLEVVPVGCDFLALSYLERKHPFNPFPRQGGFHHLELFLHEQLGWIYYRWRGWL